MNEGNYFPSMKISSVRKMSKKEEEEDTMEDSPSHNSEKTISDDDEIDYSTKPEFYDPKLDENDELWALKKRGGHVSDAVLSCPACFTTLCLDCQRHEKYVTQYRAIFVVNCKVKTEFVQQPGSKRKRKKGVAQTESDTSGETFRRVCCSVCSTDVGVIDEEDVYHFVNAIPSEA